MYLGQLFPRIILPQDHTVATNIERAETIERLSSSAGAMAKRHLRSFNDLPNNSD